MGTISPLCWNRGGNRARHFLPVAKMKIVREWEAVREKIRFHFSLLFSSEVDEWKWAELSEHHYQHPHSLFSLLFYAACLSTFTNPLPKYTIPYHIPIYKCMYKIQDKMFAVLWTRNNFATGRNIPSVTAVVVSTNVYYHYQPQTFSLKYLLLCIIIPAVKNTRGASETIFEREIGYIPLTSLRWGNVFYYAVVFGIIW